MTRLFAPERLEEFATSVCGALGAPLPVAIDVGRHLVLSNLSGHDSHGVIRLPLYVEMTDRRTLQPAALPQVLRQTPVSVLVDAGRGFGHHSTPFALELCIEKAATGGLAVGAVRHSTHIGRLGTYTEMAAAAGFVAFVTCGSAAAGYGIVAPFGASGRMLSTNPWSIGIPAEGLAPFIFDAATSTIAEGKNRVAQAKGAQLPEGALVDAAGNPTRDPEQLYAGGSLTPLGGLLAGHKGFGLSLAAALLGALAMVDDDDPTPGGSLTGFPRTGAGGVFMCIIDAGLFGDEEEYRRLVARTIVQAKAVPPAPGVSEVLYAGEPEQHSRRLRATEGIPIPDSLLTQFSAIAERFGLDRLA